jgi:hypothetical protein
MITLFRNLCIASLLACSGNQDNFPCQKVDEQCRGDLQAWQCSETPATKCVEQGSPDVWCCLGMPILDDEK